jgi:hypothetical protein
MIREVLAAVREAPPGTGLAAIAQRLGLSRDEVGAIVDYWARRGELTVEALRGCSGGCPGGCPARCPLAGGGPAACPGPALTVIGQRRPR